MIAERLFRARPPNRLSGTANPEAWFVDWFNGGARDTASGQKINEKTALTLASVWAATRFLTSKLAGLPCILYREEINGDRVRDTGDPLYSLLKDSPAPGYDAFLWWEMQWMFLINWGNAWAEKQYDPFGNLIALNPIHPSRIRPELQSYKLIGFWVRNFDGTETYVAREEMLNIVGPASEDGVFGKGVIRQARESIGLGKATEDYGARFFKNDARPGGIITHPKSVGEPARNRIREGWTKMFTGEGARGVAILDEDMKFAPIGIPPEDGQFLETRQFNVTDVARWYGIPPHCIGDLSHATFSNIEEQNINVVCDSLLPWCVRVEKALKYQLPLEDPANDYWEFLIDGLLRGNRKTRAEALQIEYINGVRTINEWRTLENLPRLKGEGGDTHFVPANVIPIDRALNPPEPPPVAAALPKGVGGRQPAGTNNQAAWALWKREWDRLTLIESKELRRLAKSPATFLNCWEEFLGQHESAIRKALGPVIEAFPSNFEVYRGTAEVFAAGEREWLATELLSVAECQPRELAGRVESFINHKLQERRSEVASWNEI